MQKIRASYAYYHDWKLQRTFSIHWTRFPWDCAMKDLCAIKAEALGPATPITGDFYEKMVIAPFARKCT